MIVPLGLRGLISKKLINCKMRYTAINKFDRLPFQDYLSLPGYSFSFLKRQRGGVVEPFAETNKMAFGTLVDALLTQPDRVPEYADRATLAEARRAVVEIRKLLGLNLNLFEFQTSFTALVTGETGFSMPVKGRTDIIIHDSVIDLKVTEVNESRLPHLIHHFGYDKQLFHYAKLAEVDDAYILFYLRKKRKCFLRKIDTSRADNFWECATLEFGRMCQRIAV